MSHHIRHADQHDRRTDCGRISVTAASELCDQQDGHRKSEAGSQACGGNVVRRRFGTWNQPRRHLMCDPKHDTTDRWMIGQISGDTEYFSGNGRGEQQRAVLLERINQIHALIDVEGFIQRQTWSNGQ